MIHLKFKKYFLNFYIFNFPFVKITNLQFPYKRDDNVATPIRAAEVVKIGLELQH